MGWREVTRKQYDCDGCGQALTDPEFEGSAPLTFPMDADIRDYDLFSEWGWHVEYTLSSAVESVKAYCPGCTHFCEGPGRTVLGKAEDCTNTDCIEARA